MSLKSIQIFKGIQLLRSPNKKHISDHRICNTQWWMSDVRKYRAAYIHIFYVSFPEGTSCRKQFILPVLWLQLGCCFFLCSLWVKPRVTSCLVISVKWDELGAKIWKSMWEEPVKMVDILVTFLSMIKMYLPFVKSK